MAYADTTKIEVAPSHECVIYIAGDYDDARRACRDWCDLGGCVSVQRVDYIYTGGEEAGVSVRLINYPRFPETEAETMRKAQKLARMLMQQLHQSSASIVGPTDTVWLSRRAIHL